ncbi:hypothetical protein DQ04_19561000 [Trypanosoma grayi]|uniref:hypothetical protein n=1 Tax=Trypanosoma grayi TaxID=71804 RepID=UPI0004F44E56|nr:hypothetical protein DQ04_19561000 [Trypanosoma grayi]KEG05660.1 hypothetical protein DQ04_19561000 [Trypanosoma grayi]
MIVRSMTLSLVQVKVPMKSVSLARFLRLARRKRRLVVKAPRELVEVSLALVVRLAAARLTRVWNESLNVISQMVMGLTLMV